jgi:hypothetical protein
VRSTRLRELARRLTSALARATGLRLVRTSRHHVIERGYYAPVPDESELTPEVWNARSDLAGIDLDLDAQLRWARDELGAFIREWSPRLDGEPGDGRFFLNNGSYQSVDAEILYAVIRRFRPRRIVELGSGFSTLAAGEACARNAAEGDAPDYAVYDPYPRGAIVAPGPWPTRRERVRAQDVPMDVFTALGDNDVLFVDTTHSVKMGGDVNRVVLDVLPRLAPGVLVHFHDIFLPWEYHPGMVAVRGFFAEQYLLQAHLAENPHWEVLFAGHAIERDHRTALEDLVPSLAGSDHHSLAFWMRRRG